MYFTLFFLCLLWQSRQKALEDLEKTRLEKVRTVVNVIVYFFYLLVDLIVKLLWSGEWFEETVFPLLLFATPNCVQTLDRDCIVNGIFSHSVVKLFLLVFLAREA